MACSRQSSQGQSPDNQATKKRKKQAKTSCSRSHFPDVPVQQNLANVIDMENKQSLFIRRNNSTYPKPEEGRGEGKQWTHT